MLAVHIGSWEKKLPILKNQHDQLKISVDALNANTAALKTSLADLDF